MSHSGFTSKSLNFEFDSSLQRLTIIITNTDTNTAREVVAAIMPGIVGIISVAVTTKESTVVKDITHHQ